MSIMNLIWLLIPALITIAALLAAAALMNKRAGAGRQLMWLGVGILAGLRLLSLGYTLLVIYGNVYREMPPWLSGFWNLFITVMDALGTVLLVVAVAKAAGGTRAAPSGQSPYSAGPPTGTAQPWAQSGHNGPQQPPAPGQPQAQQPPAQGQPSTGQWGRTWGQQ